VLSLEVIEKRDDKVLPKGANSWPKICTTADDELGEFDDE
jgi:hypothetical protein